MSADACRLQLLTSPLHFFLSTITLCRYDHENDADAALMEAEETRLSELLDAEEAKSSEASQPEQSEQAQAKKT